MIVHNMMEAGAGAKVCVPSLKYVKVIITVC